MTQINRPVPFPGSPEMREVNRATHLFHYTGSPEDGDVRCDRCDCRPSHVAASYRCGEEPPQEEVIR